MVLIKKRLLCPKARRKFKKYVLFLDCCMIEEKKLIEKEIISSLEKITSHKYIKITTRGNAAIKAALSVISKSENTKRNEILIPEEGGWLTYKDLPQKMGIPFAEVKCDDAKINLQDLQQKLQAGKYALFLYQNPGGYFAEQPMEKIYALCRKYGCLAVIDVSGSIGTELCDGNYADILVGSFGKWKLVEAHVGGFVSCKEKKLFEALSVEELKDKDNLKLVLEKLKELDGRVKFLTKKAKKIKKELNNFNVAHADDLGFVVVVKYHDETKKENNKTTSRFKLSQKESIINYCKKNSLEWTECPRYIRLNEKAVSIEVKRLLN